MTQAARTDTTLAISVADLAVKDGDERVSHRRLAAALGMSADWKLRQLVERNIVEFQRFGEVSTTAVETSAKGGRPGKLLWLNEGQAILAAVRSDAPRAADVRYQVIMAFMAYRQQRLAKPVHVREHDRRTSTTIDKAISLKRSADRLERLVDQMELPAQVPDFLRHFYVAVMSANLRVETGEVPNFGKALERTLADRIVALMGGKPSGERLLASPKALPAPRLVQCRGRRAPFKDDILRLIDEGKSNREIARATGATYPTVTHWRRMVEDGLAA